MLSAICMALGACLLQNAAQFRVHSEHATHVEVCLFDRAMGAHEISCTPLQRDLNRSTGLWSVTLSPRPQARFYGYRVWGPNWTYDKTFKPGSLTGFQSEVDSSGNRFNPNKLVIDPYALEISHGLNEVSDLSVFDPSQRALDSAPTAPKSVLYDFQHQEAKNTLPRRPFREQILYEVHLKGFTANDSSLPAAWRGTYKGAGTKAAYLHDLGVTAVEFLPVQQKASTADHPNYWGYMTLAYFAPERSYALDQSPGGPSREFREMTDAFHAQGIQVYIDVVYNHTAEGGVPIYSLRGLDNALYYDLAAADPRYYNDNTGCGHNLATFQPAVRELVLDSLHHWHADLGVDGFRFDLAPVLGNSPRHGHFFFDRDDPAGLVQRLPKELSDVDLIAEPWAIGDGTFQQGNFPPGWSEWNATAFRDPWRAFFNMRGVEAIHLGTIADALAGSAKLFQWNGRKPWNSINFWTAHDGFTLHDLFAYNSKQNNQAPPFGPSDGGEDHNRSWDQGGDPARQRQSARAALLSLILSSGTPMLQGGDEFGRTLRGNNNAYNLDTVGNYLDWSNLDTHLHDFTRYLLALRAAHPGLHPAEFYQGADYNENGLKDITWYGSDAHELQTSEFDSTRGFLAYRVDLSEYEQGPVRSALMATNMEFTSTLLQLPPTAPGFAWFRAADTGAWFESQGNFSAPGTETELGSTYQLDARNALLLLEMPTHKRLRTLRH